MQVKLLRAIQEKKVREVGASKEESVDVRILSATHRDLSKLVKLEQFREDLYFRLNVVQIRVPPLRERSSDIPLLLDFFINEISEKKGCIKPHLSPSAKRYLSSQPWHGNIRQLRNFVERLMLMQEGVLADLGTVKYLLEDHADKPPQSLNSEQKSLTDARNEFERDHIINVLEENNWRVAKAAEILGVDRANLYRKMKQLGISRRLVG